MSELTPYQRMGGHETFVALVATQVVLIGLMLGAIGKAKDASSPPTPGRPRGPASPA